MKSAPKSPSPAAPQPAPQVQHPINFMLFSEQEAETLQQIFDIAVKSGGLSVAPTVVALSSRLGQAVLAKRERDAQQPEPNIHVIDRSQLNRAERRKLEREEMLAAKRRNAAANANPAPETETKPN